MKMYTHIRKGLLILLSFNALSACLNARHRLGMTDSESEDGVTDSAPSNTEMISDISNHDFSKESLERCRNKGLPMDAKDPAGNPLLFQAVKKAVAKRDDTTDKQKIAEQELAYKEALEGIEYIIANINQEDVNATDNFNNTPLSWAVSSLKYYVRWYGGKFENPAPPHLPKDTICERVIHVLLRNGAYDSTGTAVSDVEKLYEQVNDRNDSTIAGILEALKQAKNKLVPGSVPDDGIPPIEDPKGD